MVTVHACCHELLMVTGIFFQAEKLGREALDLPLGHDVAAFLVLRVQVFHAVLKVLCLPGGASGSPSYQIRSDRSK